MSQRIPFEFTDRAIEARTDTYVACLPAKLSSKAALLRALYEQLEFPAYFGFNWDALSDCLRDFHWLEARKVVLVHVEVPRMPQAERRSYLNVLSDAVLTWKSRDALDFQVVFPAATRAEVSETIAL